MVRVLIRPHPTTTPLHSLATCIYFSLLPFFLFTPNHATVFFFFFHLIVASCVILIYPQVVRVSLYFFSFLSILGVVLLLLTKLTSSFYLFSFHFFFVFIYLACLRSLLGLSARQSKGETGYTHNKVTNSLTTFRFVPPSTWRPFFFFFPFSPFYCSLLSLV